VRHLDDGALRRLYDEPLALEEETRAHYNRCAECQSRFSAMADDARQTSALLAVPGATVDPQAALVRLKGAAATAPPPRQLRLPAIRSLGWRKPAIAGLLAAGLAATLAFTPLAQEVQNVFEPTQVTTVNNIKESDLQGLDVFKNWGDVKQGGNTSLREAGSASEAAAQSGLPPIQVKAGTLPAQVAGAPVSYGSVGQFSGTVTFTDKAPSDLHGAAMTVQAGPGQAVIYGDVNKAMTAGKQANSPQEAANAAGPMLAIVEMQAPKVTSTGASVSTIKKVLKEHTTSEKVKQAIDSIDNPQGNLPILIPADYGSAKTDQLGNGTKVTVIGDNTGLGAGVIWITNHRVYAVVGLGFSQDELKAVANGLA
jgi:hypothetical protein